jgi:hypothetical protein
MEVAPTARGNPNRASANPTPGTTRGEPSRANGRGRGRRYGAETPRIERPTGVSAPRGAVRKGRGPRREKQAQGGRAPSRPATGAEGDTDRAPETRPRSARDSGGTGRIDHWQRGSVEAGGAREPEAQGGSPRRETADGEAGERRGPSRGGSRRGDPAAEPDETDFRGREAEGAVDRAERAGRKRGETQGRQQAATPATRARRKPARPWETARSERDGGDGIPIAEGHRSDPGAGSGRAWPSPTSGGLRWDREIPSGGRRRGGDASDAARRRIARTPGEEAEDRGRKPCSEARAPGEGSGGEPKVRGSSATSGSNPGRSRRIGAEDLEDPSTRAGGSQPRRARQGRGGSSEGHASCYAPMRGERDGGTPPPAPRPREPR